MLYGFFTPITLHRLLHLPGKISWMMIARQLKLSQIMYFFRAITTNTKYTDEDEGKLQLSRS